MRVLNHKQEEVEVEFENHDTPITIVNKAITKGLSVSENWVLIFEADRQKKNQFLKTAGVNNSSVVVIEQAPT